MNRNTKRDTVIVELPLDIGARFEGGAGGVTSTLRLARAAHNGTAGFPAGITVPAPECIPEVIDTIYAKYIVTHIGYQRRVAGVLADLMREGQMPLVLSANHSMAGGVIAGLKMARPGQRLGVVWIDAHADLHSPYTTPSGNLHGMPLAASLGEDNLERRRNTPNERTASLWNEIKELGGIWPKITGSDIVFIGVRSTERPENHLLEKHGILQIPVDELRRLPTGAVVQKTLDHLSACDHLFVSFDADSLDPSISAGTGTPEPGGLTEAEASQLVRGFLAGPRLSCFEITEVNPLLDQEKKMEEVAARILNAALNTLQP